MDTQVDPRGVETSSRTDALVFLGIVALAFLLRFVHLLEARSVPIFDAVFMDGLSYSSWADKIVAGDWVGDRVFYQAPLYPYFLAVVKLAVGNDLWNIRLVQIALGSLACGVLFLAGRSFFSRDAGFAHIAGFSRGAGIAAGVLLAIYPPAIFFDGLIQKANLGLVWIVLLLWALSRARTDARWTRFALVGVPLGLLMLTREETILLVPAIGAWAILAAAPGSLAVRARPVLGFAAGLALVLLPVLVRNRAVGGEFVLTTSQAGSNFYIGNNPNANGTYVPLVPGRQNTEFERKDAFDLAEREVGRKLSPGEVSSFWFGKARAWILANPFDWLRLLGTKVALLVNWYEMPDYEDMYYYERSCGLLAFLDSFWNYGVLFPLAAAGIVLTFSQRRELAILHIVLGTLAIGVVLFYVFARYRYPLVPVLVLFAGAALARTAHLVRRRAWQDVGLAAIVVCFAGVASNWVLRDKDDQLASSLSHSGSIRADKHDDEGAVGFYEQSLRLQPDAPEVLGNLGVSLMRLQRLPEAIAAFRRSADLRPGNWRGWMRLGAALEQVGRVDEATPAIVRALDLDAKNTQDSATLLVRQTDGHDPVALDLLAAAQAALGRFDEAAATASRALEISPPIPRVLQDEIRDRIELYRKGRKLGAAK